jgi:tape measure domain-containing protein
MAVQTQVRQITVSLDAKGAAQVRAITGHLKDLNRQVSTLSGFSQLLQNAFALSFAGVGIGQVAKLVDSMQMLTDRLTVVEGSAEAAGVRLKELTDLANRTNTSAESLAVGYTRLANATAGTGVSSKSLLAITEVLQNSFRLSGASITETTNTLIQLSQAFSSGELRGQELRSIMEQNAVVARLLRKEYGADVYKKAEQGAISLSAFLKIIAGAQGEINDQAKKLRPTLEQTFTKALNDLKLYVNSINESVLLTTKFADAVEFLTKNFSLLATVLISGVIVARMTQITASILAAASAIKVFILGLNPVTAVLAAVFVGGLWAAGITSVEEFRYELKLFSAEVLETASSIATLAKNVLLFNPLTTLIGLALYDTLEEQSKKLDIAAQEYRKAAANMFAPTDGQAEVDAFLKAEKAIKDAADAASGFAKSKDPIMQINEAIAALNKTVSTGGISYQKYFNQLGELELKKVNLEFSSGKLTLEKYREEVLKLEKLDLARQFNQGFIGLEQFNTQLELLKIEEINNDLQSGKIDWQQYRSEIDKVSSSLDSGGLLVRGAERYIDSIGGQAQAITKAIESAFMSLEDSFTQFIQQGSQDWKQFAQSILDDITRIIVRYQIIAPLARGITGYFGGGEAGTPAAPSSPAATPDFTLAKVGGGNLATDYYSKNVAQQQAAPVTVNIVNNSNSEITQQESTGAGGEKILDIIIKAKVNEGIASGAFDKSMAQSYAIRRKGY